MHVQQLSEPESFSGRTSSRWLVNVNPEPQEPCPAVQGNYPDASSWYCVISCSRLSASGAWALKTERKVESGLFFEGVLVLFLNVVRNFPGGPVAKSLSFQCRRSGFDSWSGTWFHMLQLKCSHMATKTLREETKRYHMPPLKILHAAMKTEDLMCCN